MRYLFLLSLAPWALQGVAGEGVGLGEKCSDEEPCEPGLDCVRFPIIKHCMPVNCAIEAVTKAFAQTGFDLESYGYNAMEEADISLRSRLFRPNPFRGKEARNVLGNNGNDMGRFVEELKNNAPPMDLIRSAMNECTQGSIGRYLLKERELEAELKERELEAERTPLDRNLRTAGEEEKDQSERRLQTTPSPSASPTATPDRQPFTLYYGASWDAVACAAFQGDVIFASNVEGAQAPEISALNNCFGVVPGVDVGVSGLVGFAFTEFPERLIEGCKFALPIFSFGAGLDFALQMGWLDLDCNRQILLIELNSGLGAGFSLPGFTSCTTTQLS